MTQSREVLIWRPVITRGSTFRKTLTFEDSNGDPVTFVDAIIRVTPDDGSGTFDWDQGNGKFTLTGDVYEIFLDDTETAALTWSSGMYALYVEESNGDINKCLMEGPITVIDC